MEQEKPKPKTWKDIKEESEQQIEGMEMNLKIAKSVLVTANAELMKK